MIVLMLKRGFEFQKDEDKGISNNITNSGEEYSQSRITRTYHGHNMLQNKDKQEADDILGRLEIDPKKNLQSLRNIYLRIQDSHTLKQIKDEVICVSKGDYFILRPYKKDGISVESLFGGYTICVKPKGNKLKVEVNDKRNNNIIKFLYNEDSGDLNPSEELRRGESKSVVDFFLDEFNKMDTFTQLCIPGADDLGRAFIYNTVENINSVEEARKVIEEDETKTYTIDQRGIVSPHITRSNFNEEMQPTEPDISGNYITKYNKINYNLIDELGNILSPELLYQINRGGRIRGINDLTTKGKVTLSQDYKTALIEHIESLDLGNGNRSQLKIAPDGKSAETSGACYAITMKNIIDTNLDEPLSWNYIDFCNYYDQLITILETGEVSTYDAGSSLMKGGDNVRVFSLIKKYGIVSAGNSNTKNGDFIPYPILVQRDDALKKVRGNPDSSKSVARKILEELKGYSSHSIPEEFRSENLTPLEYASSLGLDTLGSDFIEISMNPEAEYSTLIIESNGNKAFNLSPSNFKDLVQYSLGQGESVGLSIDAYEPWFVERTQDDILSMIYLPDNANPYVDDSGTLSDRSLTRSRRIDVESEFTSANHAVVAVSITEFKGKQFLVCKDSASASFPNRKFPGWTLIDLEYYMKFTGFTVPKSVLLEYIESNEELRGINTENIVDLDYTKE